MYHYPGNSEVVSRNEELLVSRHFASDILSTAKTFCQFLLVQFLAKAPKHESFYSDSIQFIDKCNNSGIYTLNNKKVVHGIWPNFT